MKDHFLFWGLMALSMAFLSTLLKTNNKANKQRSEPKFVNISKLLTNIKMTYRYLLALAIHPMLMQCSLTPHLQCQHFMGS